MSDTVSDTIPFVDRKELDRLAAKLRRSNTTLLNNRENPEVNALMEMLFNYAHKLFVHQLKNIPLQNRDDLAQDACLRAANDFETFDPDEIDYHIRFHKKCIEASYAFNSRERAVKRNPKHGKKLFSFNDLLNDNEEPSDIGPLSIVDKKVKNPLDQVVEHEDGEHRQHVISYLLSDRSPLTKSQLKLLSLLKQGYSHAEIKNAMDCGTVNIWTHKKNIQDTANRILNTTTSEHFERMYQR